METQMISPAIQGGGFLITPANAEQIFTPENFNDEQRMIIQMCDEFLRKEIMPQIAALDAKQPGLMQSLLDKAGELGLLGAAFPEEYGGLGKDFITSMLITECLGGGHSFIVA